MKSKLWIDTHQHVVPPFYEKWLTKRGITVGRHTPWSAKSALSLMDSSSIAAGILSVAPPSIHFGDDEEAIRIAREINVYLASTVLC